jgi:hypothetical protein
MRYLAFVVSLLATVTVATAATITTDYPDYAPGDTVTFTGSGWQPGETVTIALHEDPTVCPDRQLTATAGDDGSIVNSDFVVDEHDIGVTFTATATGASSGLTAEATFTDACGAGEIPDASCSTTNIASCIVGCRNLATGACDDNLTAPAPRGTVCRAATDVCDVAEVCKGSEKTCPSDQLAPAGTGCRAPAGPCDAPEFCTGDSPACPSDAFLTDRVCRPAAGPCDVAEKCTGDSAQCPDDGFVDQGTLCRPATGKCDVAEVCTGVSADCPEDSVASARTVCRPSAGMCDPEEKCDGVSKDCPPDAKSADVCRPAAGQCDVAEKCDGMSNDCPPDAKSTAVCRPSAGKCDVEEKCDGQTNDCPPDVVKPSSVVCRPAVGPCDLDESCTGSSPTCPDDLIKPAKTPCLDDGNPCTKDICDGIDTDCHHPITQCSLLTNSELCTYDFDPNQPGSQFRLVYTPGSVKPCDLFKLSITNPFDFYYNVIYKGPGNTTVFIKLPYPFITFGSVPIHVYGDVQTAASSGFVCFEPGTEIASSTTQVSLASYNPTQMMGATKTIAVNVPSLTDGVAYINVHLIYGLKGKTNFSKDPLKDALDATTLAVRIPEGQSYVFSDSTPGGDVTESENAFKCSPGVAGLLTMSGTNEPVPNVTVQIYDQTNRLVATVLSDQDGWYSWENKYTGKAVTFWVKVPAYDKARSFLLAPGNFYVINFTLP